MIVQIFHCLGIDIKSINKLQSMSRYEFLSNTKIPIYSRLNNAMASNFSGVSYVFKSEAHSWEEVVQMHLNFLVKQDIEDIKYSLQHYVETRPELISIL